MVSCLVLMSEVLYLFFLINFFVAFGSVVVLLKWL